MPHLRCKLVMMGSPSVGKTSILSILAGKQQRGQSKPSVGISTMDYKYQSSKFLYDVSIWDIPGSGPFLHTVGCSCCGAAGLIFVFSVDSRASLTAVEDWLKHSDVGSDVPKLLIANKCDLPLDQREISRAKGESFAQKHDMLYYETSTSTKTAITEAIDAVLAKIAKCVSVNADPSHFMGKGIELGDTLLQDVQNWKALFGSAALDD